MKTSQGTFHNCSLPVGDLPVEIRERATRAKLAKLDICHGSLAEQASFCRKSKLMKQFSNAKVSRSQSPAYPFLFFSLRSLRQLDAQSRHALGIIYPSKAQPILIAPPCLALQSLTSTIPLEPRLSGCLSVRRQSLLGLVLSDIPLNY